MNSMLQPKKHIAEVWNTKVAKFFAIPAIVLTFGFPANLYAQDVISLDDERTKQLQELGILLPKPDTIRELARAEFSKPVLEQDPETLKQIAKEANIHSNLVSKITDEYNDYLRDNSRYEFVTEEVRNAPIVGSLLVIDSEFKTYRNQAYLNLGMISQGNGKEMEAFLFFNDAFRLSVFECSEGAEDCIRYQAEQHMKELLHIDGDSYVHWKK